jgi:hypothetical protein
VLQLHLEALMELQRVRDAADQPATVGLLDLLRLHPSRALNADYGTGHQDQGWGTGALVVTTMSAGGLPKFGAASAASTSAAAASDRSPDGDVWAPTLIDDAR